MRLSNAMIKSGCWSKAEEDDYIEILDEKIEDAWNRAIKDPYPNKKATLDYVYFKKK